MDGIRIGVVRGISYGLFGKPDEFMPAVRSIGAGLVRAYVFWGQVEPEPDRYAWDAVDALLDQVDEGTELWLTVCSASPWATRQPTDFLPPSPAKDLAAYTRFVERLVTRCAGRVSHWQPDNEPSNSGLLWAGTADEYVAQLRSLAEVVRRVDPAARVVLGGCGYDVFSAPADGEPRRFFDHLVDAGRDYFDLFAVNLYGDPARVPSYVATARRMMRAHGYERPVVAGELGGPMMFEFPDVEAAVGEVFAAAFADAPETQSTAELIERAGLNTPERRAMAALYARMPDLPPRLRMLMAGCEPELEAKRHRINARQLVARTVLALASGVRRTAYWCLGPEVPAAADPYQMMYLMVGKLPLFGYDGGALTVRHPAADAFARLAERLAGAVSVTAVDVPAVYAFRVERPERGPLLVVWQERDAFDGEDEPPVDVTPPWDGPGAARDAFGRPVEVRREGGGVRLAVTDTPVYLG